jgi:2-polyprenyl-3-methyl-5-hydroxy-6-metoxy-1,4-benzoquinol methylase
MRERPPLSVIEQAVRARVARLPLGPGARVLDAPCGSGALVAALVEAGYDASGTDVVHDAAQVIGDRFMPADLGAGIPAADASFDAVLSVEGIEHLENPFAFLREIRRVLRPGGLLVLTTPNTVSLRSRVRFFHSGFYNQDPRPLDESAPHPLHHISLRTFPELRYALHTAGLRIEQVGHTHIKPISYAYGILAPLAALYTAIAFRKGKREAERARNREVRRALLSRSLLYGENVMLTAARRD